MGAKLIETDRGWDRFVRVTKELEKDPNVRVGVLADAGAEKREDGFTNVEIAAVHEFGTDDGRVPERSFIRSSFERNGEKYKEHIKALVSKVVEGKVDLVKALNVLGLGAATDVKRGISEGLIKQDLAESTLARKEAKTRPGSTGVPKALIDTGRLLGSITWAVFFGDDEQGGGEK